MWLKGQNMRQTLSSNPGTAQKQNSGRNEKVLVLRAVGSPAAPWAALVPSTKFLSDTGCDTATADSSWWTSMI
jgi:hypothetical protein